MTGFCMQGRTVLWGWMQELNRRVGDYSYAGCISVPRLLWLHPGISDSHCESQSVSVSKPSLQQQQQQQQIHHWWQLHSHQCCEPLRCHSITSSQTNISHILASPVLCPLPPTPLTCVASRGDAQRPTCKAPAALVLGSASPEQVVLPSSALQQSGTAA